MGDMPRNADGATASVRAALGGHLPLVLVEGVLPTGELRRAVAAAYVDHFGPCPSAARTSPSVCEGGGGGGSGGGDDTGGRHLRHWSQEQRVALLARFVATTGDAALATEAAALTATLGLSTAAAAAAPRTAVDVAGRIMDAAAARRLAGWTLTRWRRWWRRVCHRRGWSRRLAWPGLLGTSSGCGWCSWGAGSRGGFHSCHELYGFQSLF